MPNTPSRADLLAVIDHYAAALVRIMGKREEFGALEAHLGKTPPNEDAENAYRKCAVIAELALRQYHPELCAPPPTTKRPTRRRTATTKRTPARKKRTA